MESSPYASVAALLHPGSRLSAVDHLSGGVSAQMLRLTLLSTAGAATRVVLRRQSADALAARPDATAEEFRLLQFLHRRGLPVPVPLLLDERREILPQPYAVLSYVDGCISFAPENLEVVLDQMAATLARIHQSADAQELACLNLSSVPACREQFGTWTGDDRLHKAVRAAMSSAPAPIHPNQPALLHGDYWPGNTVWHRDKLAAVIDWEDAARGDPLIDVARARSELVWIYGRRAMERFTTVYRRHNRLDWRDLPYWDLCAGLRQLRLGAGDFDSVAAYFADYGRTDLTGTHIQQMLYQYIHDAITSATEAWSA